jgi:hypothetical protein
VLTAIGLVGLAGCAARSSTGGTTGGPGNAAVDGSPGMADPDDDAGPLLSADAGDDAGPLLPGDATASTGCLEGTSCAGEGGPSGRTNDATAGATTDSGQGHTICSQSWSGVLSGNLSLDPHRSARMLALDGAGDIYVAAGFNGTVTVAGQMFQSAGSESLLVVKLDPSCKVLWAKAFGAAQATVGLGGIAADAIGNVVVAASIIGASVDFGSGALAPGGAGGDWAGVIFKLGPDGAGLWSHAYPAAFLSAAHVTMVDVALDAHGNIAFAADMALGSSVKGTVTGAAPMSVDFGGGAVTYSATLVGLNANGQFVFDADVSVHNYSWPNSLTMDATGQVWVVGMESGATLPLVVSAFDSSGHPLWVQGEGVSGYAAAWDPVVRVDSSDDLFTAQAWAQSTDDGGLLDDSLLYKLSSSGSASWTPPATIPAAASDPQYRWSSNPWITAWPGGRLAVDSAGRALVASLFAGNRDFGSAGNLTSAGGLDSVVLRFDAQGHLAGGLRWGGADDDLPLDVAIDSAGDAVIAGWSVPEQDGGSGPTPASPSYAIFVAKLAW